MAQRHAATRTNYCGEVNIAYIVLKQTAANVTFLYKFLLPIMNNTNHILLPPSSLVEHLGLEPRTNWL